MIQDRNRYFDFLRGIAIIMVVGIHSMVAEPIELKEFRDFSIAFIRMSLNCAVPIFLAVSGYFIGKKEISFGQSYFDFLRRQLPKVYIPCLIFSIPYFILYLRGHGSVVKGFLMLITCSFSIYYFVALIIQYYILLPILERLNTLQGLIITVIISGLAIVAITFVMKVLDYQLPLIVYAGTFPIWILFFFMGLYFSSRSRNYGLMWPLVLTSIGMILQFIELNYWLSTGHNALGIKISSFIFSAGVILLLFSDQLENRFRETWLTSLGIYVGSISFGIYLIHCFSIQIVDHISCNISCLKHFWPIYWIIVLLMSIGIIWLTKLICPKFAHRYLGFR